MRIPRKVMYIGGSALAITAGLLIGIAVAMQKPATDEQQIMSDSSSAPEQAESTAPEATEPEPESTAPPSNNPPATPPAPAKPSPTPSSVLGLNNWKLTLPVNTASEITQPKLATFTSAPYFQLTSAGNGVQFRAPVGGSTTSNSKYPRSELREMTSAGKLASWSNASGTHTMTVRQAITHLPVAKPEVVAGQIHDGGDDVIMIKLQGKHLYAYAEDENIGSLDTNYTLGKTMTIKIVASGGHIKVFYNDVQKVDYAKSGSGFYFKAGCYTQSNPSRGDAPDAYGEVIIYSLNVSHT